MCNLTCLEKNATVKLSALSVFSIREFLELHNLLPFPFCQMLNAAFKAENFCRQKIAILMAQVSL